VHVKYSKLEQERILRGWSRAYIEAIYEIPASSLERWEKGKSRPGQTMRDLLSRIYGKTPEELDIVKRGNIVVGTTNVPTSQEEQLPMSDLMRREVFRNLGSRLTSLIDTWPKRSYHYAELQEGINRALLGYNTVVAQEPTYELTRRQAVNDMIFVPMQLMGGIALIESGKVTKVDTDILLKHCAAGITACWYLRRGKELNFVSDVVSTYISILQPLIYSKSEVHRKAVAGLLAQSFRLKGSIIEHLKNGDQAIIHYNEAIRYAFLAENTKEQAIANRMMAFSHWRQGPKRYEEALPYAEKAYGLARSDKGTHRNIQSFTASGLSLCQAVNGHMEDAKVSLAEARNLFDPTMLVPSMYYDESNLFAIGGAVHRSSGIWQESVDLYKKCLASDISALGAVQGRINYAKTEVSRDDQDRDMDLCVKLLSEAIPMAVELDSKHYIAEARECYTLLHAAWPRETEVKKLLELF
jgi:tetratricopeptide (TPR) repeat protein